MSRSSRGDATASKTAGSSSYVTPLTLERKLELLESRFTQPAGGSVDPPQPLMISTATGGETSFSRSSNSQHSFSFAGSSASNSAVGGGGGTGGSPSSQQHQHSNLPSSAVRSKRRPSLSASFHAVERATTRHLRRVAANNSPVQGRSSTNNNNNNNNNNSTNNNTAAAANNLSRMSSNSNASQQTLLTSHVQQQRPRIVAESPPVPVTPGVPVASSTITPNTTHPPKPSAARNILHSAHHPTPGATTANAGTSGGGSVTSAASTVNATTSTSTVSVELLWHVLKHLCVETHA